MKQIKLEELKDYVDSYFKDEHSSVIITKGKFECIFENSRYANQFVNEVKEVKNGFRTPRYDGLVFEIIENKVIVKA